MESLWEKGRGLEHSAEPAIGQFVDRAFTVF